MAKTVHGMSRSRLYHIWNSMKMRCINPKAISYKYYGEKGVKVCEEWQTFTPFMKWAMKNGYEEHLTIDRIDANGNYCPENCRWATPKEQQNNTSYNHVLEYCGEKHSVMEWSVILGIPHTTLYNRLQRGWDINRALTTKRRKYREV